MALKLENYENENGVKITYWKIGRIFISFSDKICNVYIQGYVDEQARLNDKMYVEERIFNFPENENGVEFPFPFDDNENDEYSLRPMLYEKLKQFEFFKDAVDC